MLCPGQEPIWVALDSLVALAVMGLQKVVFFVDELMWLYYRRSTTFPCVSSVLARKVLGTAGPHIPLPYVEKSSTKKK